METKANYVAVGAFTVLVFAAAFAFVYWFARNDTGGETAQLNIVIAGSVTGLANSSVVKFNGIDVGKVDRLGFDATDPGVVIAETQVRRDLPITAETKAVLSFTGLTGIAHIELEGGAVDQPNVFELAEREGTVATIDADPTALNDLLATAQDIANRANNILTDVESFVADARGPLTRAVENVTEISDALAANSGRIDEFLTGMGDLGESLGTMSVTLERTLSGADELIAAVDPDDVAAIVTEVRGFAADLNEASDDLDGLVASARTTLEGLESIGDRVDQSFDQLDTLIGAVDPDAVGEAVSGFADAGRAARDITADIQGVTAELEGRGEDIDTIFANVTEMSERLNAASVRVDGVLEKLDGFLGEGGEGGQNLIAEASETLRSFRDVASNLNARLDSIGGGLERFSDRGLRDIEALVNETRRSISRIEQTITSIERDPQQLIFGGDGGVKRFDGRERR
ncbi:MlaD family protein [Oceaniradius stylonematis]|jgi:phospholipid/cholesterol/gamma-HCH transport system substrate-binding protein|uniref:MlaD family protein n=1 Tax=Oceaniradius stylonematis TaxID=2184161 RepID=UPI00273D037B|nr:MlaD family protein [Oceaniradius stylonematis]